MVAISMDPVKLDPGGSTTVTVKITPVNGGPVGFYVQSRGQGSFSDIPGQGTRLATPTEIVHSAPKRGDSFQVRWTAPTKIGAYSLEAWGVSANGNNQPSGDNAASASLPLTVGCDGIDVYVDIDGDGYGSNAVPVSRACELNAGFALKAGDCNDSRSSAHPGGTEACNGIDDDCNGMIDEGLEGVMLYPDADGDGYGARFSTEGRMGCAGVPPGMSFSPLRNDCDDTDRNIHPGAMETCNNKDDNCNARVDEGARLSCGMGRCRTVADTCAATSCVPGTPQPEECNFIDDDCDGVIDNNARCDPGRVCTMGRCLLIDDAAKVMEANNSQLSDGGAPASSGGGGGSTDGGARKLSNASVCNYGAAGAGVVTGRAPLVCLMMLLVTLRARRRRSS
jgi:hypothetical protein